MKVVNIGLGLILLSACSNAPAAPKSNETIRPGEVRVLKFPIVGQMNKFKCRDQEIKFGTDGKHGLVVVMESYFSDLSSFSCKYIADNNVVHEYDFTVVEKIYKAEKLKVDHKRVKLNPEDQKRADEEQVILNQVYANSPREQLFKKPFMQPLMSHVTSVYGTKRVYNKEKKGQHLGTDYRAAIGDKVPTSNRGRVVFAGDLFYTGGTVIVDHGLDIFTVYGHLSETKVNAGDMVERGDLIGLSGNSGRTSGPHLHWGVKIQGQYIDGISLIEETKKFLSE